MHLTRPLCVPVLCYCVLWFLFDRANASSPTKSNPKDYAYYQFQRWWPFNQMSLVNSISLIFQNLGNGGFNELDNWLFF